MHWGGCCVCIILFNLHKNRRSRSDSHNIACEETKQVSTYPEIAHWASTKIGAEYKSGFQNPCVFSSIQRDALASKLFKSKILEWSSDYRIGTECHFLSFKLSPGQLASQ